MLQGINMFSITKRYSIEIHDNKGRFLDVYGDDYPSLEFAKQDLDIARASLTKDDSISYHIMLTIETILDI